jgi:ribonuclease Z
MELAPPA